MEETLKRKLFPGAGILVGFVIGLMVLAVIISFTGRVKSAIPIGIATGSSIGTVIEQYLPGRKGTDPAKKKAALLIIALGGIMLFILYFITSAD